MTTDSSKQDQVGGRLKHGLLLAFVAMQLIVPLTYYLRADVYDERFAWRMFSAVRLQRCNTQVSETGSEGTKVLRLTHELHQGWIGTLGRNRISVIESFMAHRCNKTEINAVRLTNTCNTLSDAKSSQYAMDCKSKKLTREP